MLLSEDLQDRTAELARAHELIDEIEKLDGSSVLNKRGRAIVLAAAREHPVGLELCAAEVKKRSRAGRSYDPAGLFCQMCKDGDPRKQEAKLAARAAASKRGEQELRELTPRQRAEAWLRCHGYRAPDDLLPELFDEWGVDDRDRPELLALRAELRRDAD